MKKYIIILIILLIIIYLICFNDIENFQAPIYDSPNCCVIRKRRDYDIFKYYYNTSKYCDVYHNNLIRTVREDELIDGKPFKMEYCKENILKPIFGSCREPGEKSCTDFMTKKDCVKYPGLVWNPSVCRESLNQDVYYNYEDYKEEN